MRREDDWRLSAYADQLEAALSASPSEPEGSQAVIKEASEVLATWNELSWESGENPSFDWEVLAAAGDDLADAVRQLLALLTVSNGRTGR